jgi:hypothetical protein
MSQQSEGGKKGGKASGSTTSKDNNDNDNDDDADDVTKNEDTVRAKQVCTRTQLALFKC